MRALTADPCGRSASFYYSAYEWYLSFHLLPVRNISLYTDGEQLSGLLLRSEVHIELNFPPKLRGARLYRRRFLQVNTRWKALAEIYTMHSFAPFSKLNFFVKNRQNFFAIELINIH